MAINEIKLNLQCKKVTAMDQLTKQQEFCNAYKNFPIRKKTRGP